MKDKTIHPLVTRTQIKDMPEKIFEHRFNSNAVRHTKSLSDYVGMTHLGLHIVRLESGKESTQFHFHHQEEEFLYIISGKGIAEIDDDELEVTAGDFLGFTAPSLPHSMKNPFEEDLVYLMGGERKDIEIVDYPRIRKRLHRISGLRNVVDMSDIESI